MTTHNDGRAGRAALFGLLLLAPLVFWTGTAEAFESNKAALLAAAALALVVLAGRRLIPANPGREPAVLGVALFAASAAVSTVFSLSPRTSLAGAHESHAGLGTVAAYAVVFFAARALCARPDDARRLMRAAVLAGAAASVYALVQLAGLDPVAWDRTSDFAGYVRPFATMGHPNHLGAYLAAAFPLAAVFAADAARRRRWPAFAAFALAAALGAVVIVATLSRGAWLAFAAALLVFAAARRRLACGLAAGLGLTALAAGLACLAAPDGPQMLDTLARRARGLADAPARMHLWRAGIEVFADHPLSGCGLDTFQLAFQSKRTVAFWETPGEWGVTPLKAHNEAVHILATQGLFGAGAAGGFLAGLAWAAARAVRRAAPEDRPFVLALAAGAVAFCVQALFSFAVVGCGVLFVVQAALLTRLASPEIVPVPVRPPWPGGRIVSAGLWAGAVAAAYFGVFLPVRASSFCREGLNRLDHDPQEALACLERAASVCPGNDLYWTHLGTASRACAEAAAGAERRRLLLRVGEAFDRAAQLVPANMQNHANRGLLLADLAREGLADPDTAFAVLDRALAGDPNNLRLYTDAGRAALLLGQPKRCTAYARRALDLGPRFAQGHALLGAVALAEKRFADAADDLGEAVVSDWRGDTDGFAAALTMRAMALMELGRFEEAAGTAQLALTWAPDSAASRAILARALQHTGQ